MSLRIAVVILLASWAPGFAAPDIAKCAKLGGVSVGMTPDQILKSCWGKPVSVNLTITARGKHEQWVYWGGYLYLDGGVLTTIQVKH